MNIKKTLIAAMLVAAPTIALADNLEIYNAEGMIVSVTDNNIVHYIGRDTNISLDFKPYNNQVSVKAIDENNNEVFKQKIDTGKKHSPTMRHRLIITSEKGNHRVTRMYGSAKPPARLVDTLEAEALYTFINKTDHPMAVSMEPTGEGESVDLARGYIRGGQSRNYLPSDPFLQVESAGVFVGEEVTVGVRDPYLKRTIICEQQTPFLGEKLITYMKRDGEYFCEVKPYAAQRTEGIKGSKLDLSKDADKNFVEQLRSAKKEIESLNRSKEKKVRFGY